MDFTMRVSSVEKEATVYGIGVLTRGRTLHSDVMVDAEEQQLGIVPWMSTQRLCGEPFGRLLPARSLECQSRVKLWRHLQIY